jgi:AcrR family transcriptional regulator
MPPGTPRGRPRDARADQRILEVARDSLLAHGYAGLAIDTTAERAGVAKTTLYRRWPTKDHLAVAVFADMLDQDVPVGDTGDIHADLTTYLHQIASTLDRVRRAGRAAGDSGQSAGIVAELIAAASRHEDIGHAVRALYTRRIALAVTLIERAIRRGALRRDTDPVILLDQLGGALYYRVLITGAPTDLAYLDRLVGAALRGAVPASPRSDAHDHGTVDDDRPGP